MVGGVVERDGGRGCEMGQLVHPPTHPPGAVAKARNMGQAPFGTWTMAVAGDTRGTRNIPF